VPGDLGVLLISGSARPPANFLAETWAFAPSAGWSNLDPDPVIDVSDHAAYAAASGLVYAGVGATWLLDPEASTWQKLDISGPPFEPGSRSAYDSQSNRIVLYSADGSTWALDLEAETWQRLAPALSPPARGWGGIGYDPVADRVVLFGGVGAGDVHLADTWAYDLDTDTWTELETGPAPAGRTYGAMTYDPVGKRMLLFGGATGEWEAETVLDDTWSFDVATAAWVPLEPSGAPSARAWHAMAFDAETGLVILFGGGPDRRHYTAETWLYDPGTNAWSEWRPD
jgi:N-acetylneuraminic acid mutarotase